MSYDTVFKVLRGKDSAFDHGDYTLQYIPYKWTSPSLGKIYAFQDYEHALRWAAEYSGNSIWEAEAEIFKDGNCMMCSDEKYHLWAFWKWYSAFLKGEASSCPPSLTMTYSPNGTVLCNKLRITKKFKDVQ